MNALTPAAIGWSATFGLIPGYGHDNDPDELAERKSMLSFLWEAAMTNCFLTTGFTISAVMTEAVVLYPSENGCPIGGESAMTLSGSSNPAHVSPDQFDAYIKAVEEAICDVQFGMEQTSCRIEFTAILQSTYSRLDREIVRAKAA